ncbi:MAG: cupin domain-containing protein [Candidatus Thiodiazotropha taylori]|nr:cupin domain-containing protein [Candidatus Thiodiazotropha taylori]
MSLEKQDWEMDSTKEILETATLKSDPDYNAPDGSEIRLLPTMNGGGLCHCTLPTENVSSPVAHKHGEEIWYVLEGEGEIWRSLEGQEQTTPLSPGISITIPPKTRFQFRNTGKVPLSILICTMPPWPGPDEAQPVQGRWKGF